MAGTGPAPPARRGYSPLVERPRAVGRYQLEQEVARGGTGVVYRARTPDGRAVALKLLLAGRGASPLQRRRVATEIQALLRLRHPNVVELLDAGEHEGVPYLVMEWIAGETLAARLARQGPLDPLGAGELVRRLATAVEHCHARDVLHRDLKPGNVMLRASDEAPLLTDFGLSKDLASDGSGSGSGQGSELARSVRGRWLGTPGFWPPEQARGELEAIGPASDVYGLGAILYCALTGRSPQEGRTLPELVADLERPVLPPSQRRAGIPPWLEAACLRALSPDARRRHPSPAALAEELEAGARGEVEAGPKAAPSRRAAPLVAACVVLGGAALAGAVLLRSRAQVVTASTAPTSTTASPPPPPLARSPAPPREEPAPPASSSPAAPPVDVATARSHYQRGILLYQRGDLGAARRELERAIELDPGHAESHYMRGLVRGQQGDADGARADLDRALEVDPGLALVWFERGRIASEERRHPEAILAFDRYLELRPADPKAWIARASSRMELGDHAGAVADYTRASELDPNDEVPIAMSATASFRAGDYRAAVDGYTRALGKNSMDGGTYHNRGNAKLMLGDLEGALADFERALNRTLGAANPVQLKASILRSRAIARERSGDPARAADDLEQSLRLDPREPRRERVEADIRRLRALPR